MLPQAVSMCVIPGGVPGQTAGARLAAEHVLGGGGALRREGGGSLPLTMRDH